MRLYHFPNSPFARRVRLALAHKGLSAALLDVRADPEHAAALRRLNPLHFVPVLVDGERVVADSNAILQYLDRKHPEPPLWPGGLAGVEGFEISAQADTIVSILADLGLRYAALQGDPAFPQVREVGVGRIQRTLDALAARLDGRVGPICGGTWGAADIAAYTLVAWLEGLPARAPTTPLLRPLLALGWSLPPALSAWADQHRGRADVVALDAPAP